MACPAVFRVPAIPERTVSRSSSRRKRRKISRSAVCPIHGGSPSALSPAPGGARDGADIQSAEGQALGVDAWGVLGPTVNGLVAMGYVAATHSKTGTPLK